MPEELRIVVVDQGGGGSGSSGGGQFPRVAGGGRVPGAPPVQPPPFVRPPPVQPPPVQPSPRAPRDPFRGAISAAGTAGGVAGAAAAGNVAGAASRASSGIVAAVGGPIGLAVAAVAAGFGAAAIAAVTFARAVESQTSKLAGFSGPLAAAQARTEIGRELGLLRRAQRIGPELASAERLRSKFEGTMTDLTTEILRLLLRFFEEMRPLIEVVIAGTSATTNFLEQHGDKIGEGAFAVARGINPKVATAVEIILGIANLMRGEVERREDDEFNDPFTQQFLDLMPRDTQGQPLFWPAGQPVPQPGV